MNSTPASPASHRLTLIRALAAAHPPTLSAWLDANQLTLDDVRWLQKQGVAVFAWHEFERAELLAHLPADAAGALQDIYHYVATTSAAQDWQIERVLQTLTEAGVAFAWVKGGMLAYTVYANPTDRYRGDLDLWIQPAQLAQAQALLEGLGYVLHSKQDRPPALAELLGAELQLVSKQNKLHLIELQSPVIRGEWIRVTAAVDQDGIWQRRVPVGLDGRAYPTLAPEDTLIHLCIHQAVNHQFAAPWLRNLLDVHQVTASYDLDWGAVADRSAAWRVATVVWTTLDLATRLLGTAVPAATMQQMEPSGLRRRLLAALHLDQALLAPRQGGYGHRRFLIQLALVDRLRDAARLLLRGAFPEAAWLRARYEMTPDKPLWRLRLDHLWLLATSARA